MPVGQRGRPTGRRRAAEPAPGGNTGQHQLGTQQPIGPSQPAPPAQAPPTQPTPVQAAPVQAAPSNGPSRNGDPAAGGPPADRAPGNRQQTSGRWDAQAARANRTQRANPGAPMPAPGPLGSAAVAMPARSGRGGPRQTGSTRLPGTRGGAPLPPRPAMPTGSAPVMPQAPAPAVAPPAPMVANLPAPAAEPMAPPAPGLPIGAPVGPLVSRPGMAPVAKPAEPAAEPAEAAPSPTGGPERREDMDPISLTTELEPISEGIQQKRKIDATLARFSAVHDEMAEEERQRRSQRMKLMPWRAKDDDLEEALSANSPATAIVAAPAVAPEDRPDAAAPPTQRTEGLRAAPDRGGANRTGQNRPARGARPPAKTGKRGRQRPNGKLIAGVAAGLVLVVCFVAWRAQADAAGSGPAGGGIQEVAALDENSPAIIQSDKQFGDSNFLLVGTSSRPGDPAGASDDTDPIMVAHIPVDGSRVVITSLPPNLEVNRPACQRWDNKASSTTQDPLPPQNAVKLGAIYSAGGPKCVTDTVQQLTGLRINHFVGIDFAGFRNLVDSVQGVTLCAKTPLQDAALGTIVDHPGQVTLSGDKALNYVRAAQIIGDPQIADFGRINRQERFLAAMLRKTIGQQNLLMNANLLNRFLGTFTKSTFGDNMGVSQLTKLAQSLQGLSLGRVTFVMVPTADKLNAAGHETLLPDQTKQLFTAVIDNSPLPGEVNAAPAASPAGPALDPKNIKIQVINGTTEGGLAGDATDKLGKLGFDITAKGGLAPPNVTTTVIKYSAAQQDQARFLASSVPAATLQVDPSLDGAIQLILGPGFDRQIVPPHAGATPNTSQGGSAAPAGLSYVNAADTSCG